MKTDSVKFVIEVPPVTKKNHQQIIKARGHYMIIQSKQYRQYEKDAMYFLPKTDCIIEKVNIKAVFYMPTRRKVDLTNLLEALDDVLVKGKIIEDDNCSILYSHDGSRVLYDKDNPRTEVEITAINE